MADVARQPTPMIPVSIGQPVESPMSHEAVLQLIREDKITQAAAMHADLVSKNISPTLCYSSACRKTAHDIETGSASPRPKWAQNRQPSCYSLACKQRRAFLADMQKRLSIVHEMQRELRNIHGWALRKESHAIRVYSKFEPGSTLVTIRVDGFINAKLLHILAIFHEVDMWTTWMPSYNYMGLKSSDMCATGGPTRFLVNMVFGVPWPMATRDLMVNVEGVDCMDDASSDFSSHPSSAAGAPHSGTQTDVGGLRQEKPQTEATAGDHPPEHKRQIVVLMNSASDFCGRAVRPPAKDHVRMDLNVGAIVFTPRYVNGGGSGTDVQLICRLDPKLSLVPDYIVNLASKEICFLFFELLDEQAKKVPGSVYEERINADVPFYQYLKSRLKEINYPEDE
eukprot:m.330900 g.330900  ORF g.330900 m.330900 type:complete len:396 (-) comp20464_c1_seq5:426-1613(-)